MVPPQFAAKSSLSRILTYPRAVTGAPVIAYFTVQHAAPKGIQRKRVHCLAPPGSSLGMLSPAYLVSSTHLNNFVHITTLFPPVSTFFFYKLSKFCGRPSRSFQTVLPVQSRASRFAWSTRLFFGGDYIKKPPFSYTFSKQGRTSFASRCRIRPFHDTGFLRRNTQVPVSFWSLCAT